MEKSKAPSRQHDHSLDDMNEGSDEDNYLPKTTKRSMVRSYSSTPRKRRSARLQSRYSEENEPRTRWKLRSCRADLVTKKTQPIGLTGDSIEEIEAPTPRDTASGFSQSVPFHRNVQRLETGSPDRDNEEGGRCSLEHSSCKSTGAASLLRTAGAPDDSSSSDVPSHAEDAGERNVRAEEELEVALDTDNALQGDHEDVEDAETIFPDTARQGVTEGDQTPIHDNMSCRSIGVSLFEMVNNFNDLSSDATSSLDNIAQVGPYCMSQDLAPILHAIIMKHGNIASGCRLKSPAMVRDVLEKVCTAVQNLQNMPFQELKESDLASLNDVIVIAEGARLDVEWLRHHYDILRETVNLIPQYKNLKYNITKKFELVGSRKSTLDLKKRTIDSMKLEILKLESECRMMDSELEMIGDFVNSLKKDARDIEPKLRRFHNGLAGNGLL